jgi:hypothetical protein
MLKLRSKTVQIGRINPRLQWNGDEPISAMDIPIQFLVTAKEAASLTNEPHTPDAWFETEDGELSEPLLKHMAPFKLQAKFENSNAVLSVGLKNEEFDLGNVTLAKLSFDPQSRGETSVDLKIQCLITSKNIGLFLWMGKEASAKLQFGEMTTNEDQQELDLDAPGDDDAGGEEFDEGVSRNGADNRPSVN